METEEEKAEREAKELEEKEKENQNSGPTKDEDAFKLLQSMVEETNRRARAEEGRRIQLERELADLKKKNNPPPAEISAEQFFEKPAETLRNEIGRQVAPLIDFVNATKKRETYLAIKTQFFQDPRYNHILQKIGAQVDAAMENLEPTVQNVANAISVLVGHHTLENPNFFAQTKEKEDDKTPKKEEEKLTTPAHLRPSAAPRNIPKDEKPKKNYTEHERRLMREYNMTEDEWEAALNSTANLSGLKKKVEKK